MSKSVKSLHGWLYQKSPSLFDLVTDALVGTWSLQSVLTAVTPF